MSHDSHRPRVHLLGLEAGDRFTLTAADGVIREFRIVAQPAVPRDGHEGIVRRAREIGGRVHTLAAIAHANGGSYFVHPIHQETRRGLDL